LFFKENGLLISRFMRSALERNDTEGII
jgi:hypothetical protein